jgi:cytochrome c oxidase subunit 2
MLTIIAVAVSIAVCALLLGALFRPRRGQGEEIERRGASVRWILIGGVFAPAVILVVAFALTVYTQAGLARAPDASAPSIRVVGHRWWWEVLYAVDGRTQTVVTANEVHLPVGVPTRIELVSDDVIHSFWVPRLAGKTDLIPGQRNTMWMEAQAAGTYWGQCAEYCGVQHARMDLIVVAESRPDYDAWLARQREAAVAPSDSLASRGILVFSSAMCAACHAVRGADAHGTLGPDLTHLGSRRTLAAGTLPNTRGNLAGWIANAQSIKPGSLMPTIPLSADDSRALLAYLETLH